MGEATDRLSVGTDEPREQVAAIDEELEDLRHELSMLVDELDRRREALDPRVQIRRHPLTGALAGGLLGVAGGLALAVARRRRHSRPPGVAPTARALPVRARATEGGP